MGNGDFLAPTNNGHEVTVWSIDAREVEMLDQEREHKTKLPGVRLQDTIRFTNAIDQAIQGRDFVVLAVPSPFTRSTAEKDAAVCFRQTDPCQCGKGDRGDDADDIKRADRRGNPTGRCSCALGAKPR